MDDNEDDAANIIIAVTGSAGGVVVKALDSIQLAV